jgi:hypothetical protein
MAAGKKKPPFNQEMAIRGANRRLFARSPLVIDKLNESRQEFPRYKKDGTLAKKPWVKRQCEVCGLWVSSTKISIDHIDPVVPPDGFPAHFDLWDRITLFLKRLWCDKSNLQRICDECHDKKTYSERIDRLLKKYKDELDLIEDEINKTMKSESFKINSKLYIKGWNKELSKYTAKKKTIGLESVVQRAQKIKDLIKQKE